MLGDEAPEIDRKLYQRIRRQHQFVESRLKGLKDEQRPTVLT